MRYFVELAYNGSKYFGWQKQPEQVSVQSTLENAFSTILGQAISVTGCGRTDTGVHAQQYFMHFDFEGEFPKTFVKRINKFLPPDIVIREIQQVAATAHARFDATSRAYSYYINLAKDPFRQKTSYFYPFAETTDPILLKEAAQLLLNYDSFFPFCKTGHDAHTMICHLSQSEWELKPEQWIFHISANRFLRGMVRLIVGMCLNVGMGKIPIEEVRSALENQKRLAKSWSVPPEGLFLRDIQYPYINKK